MTTEQFYQIASCASMIQDLADKGAEMSNAIRVTNENSDFYKNACWIANYDESIGAAELYENEKAKNEEGIKAKNEELQKLINQ